VPAGGIDWTTVLAAMHSWVVSGSGLSSQQVVWGQQDAPRPEFPALTLRISNISDIGSTWIDFVDKPFVFADKLVSSINLGTGALTSTAHGLLTGDGPVRLSSTGTYPSTDPVVDASTDLWIIKVDANSFQLAYTFQNAMALTPVPVEFTTGGSGIITVSDTPATVRAGQELQAVARGLIRATLEIRCHADLTIGPNMAVAILQRIRTRYQWPSQQALLEAANVTLQDIDRVRAIMGTRDDFLFEPRAYLDVHMCIPVEEGENATIIERVIATNQIPTPEHVFEIPTPVVPPAAVAPPPAGEKWLLVMIGQSNDIGFMSASAQTFYGTDLTLSDPRGQIIDRNASAFANPPNFIDEGPRDLSPRSIALGGSYVSGTGGIELTEAREIMNRTPHTVYVGKMGIDGSSLITGWDNPAYPIGGTSLANLLLARIATWLTLFGVDANHIIIQFIQGEADTGQAYATILAALQSFLVTKLRGTYPNAYLALGRLSNKNDNIGNYRTAQESFYSITPNTTIFYNDDLGLRDAAHLTDNGYAQHGVYAADAVIPMMMATTPTSPRYIATGPFVIAGSGVGATPVLPKHLAGDIIIVWATALGNNAYTLTTANGFVEGTASPQHDGTNSLAARAQYWWVRADQPTMDANGGQMPAPVIGDVAGDDFKMFAASVYRGCVSSGNPINTAVGSTAPSGTAVVFPAITTTAPNCLVINYIAYRVDDPANASQVSGWSNPDIAPLTELIDKDTNSGQGFGMGKAVGFKAASGSVQATTATLGTASTMALLTVALKA